jgi:mannosyl-glycoprotein endo-beta-N-acetylglucosaminidase
LYYARLLVDIAEWHGLDGWFINIESPLNMNQVTVEDFWFWLQCFKQMMHERLPGSLVLWYDSLTMDGKVSFVY